MLADMNIRTPWKHYSTAAEQKNKQINEAMRQITNVMKRARKKGALSEYFQINNRNTKYQKIEHKLETNTAVCKYLKNSRHGNLLLRK